ncbi:MAG TPA: FIST N-terminal domain-containing protein, partial [Streptosporangiaceae bacterium]|nr:FIST N-terminal domain-containing protein [Streptosporangiaceae bacterium]
MKAGGALVLTADPGEAATRAVAQAAEALGDASPSLAVLFASARFLGVAEALVAAISNALGKLPLIGCVGEAVAGGAREVESEPAVSLWLGADLGPVETFAMEYIRTPSGGAYAGYLFPRERNGTHLLICDPFTFPADGLLTHLNEQVPGAVVMGGMASAALRPEQSRLFLDDRVLSSGAVGVHLPNAEVHPLVAQGCRPIGDAYIITRADGNLIHELGGRPPLVRLREMAAALPSRDTELLAQGLQLGVLIDEYQAEPGQGDFLIRGVVGADPDSGAMAVGDQIQVGQTVQFHVRDAQSADEDLRRALERESAALGGRRPAGALLFTCNGRGSRLFTEPDHDAGLIAATLGDIPVAGFFCAGELGPVGGQNFLHTFTASIALF